MVELLWAAPYQPRRYATKSSKCMCEETYKYDDAFKAKARLHQSNFRREVLCVDGSDYGNRLKEEDAKKYLAYYDRLGVRESLLKRYGNFSLKRDGDLLRSEHIPFNLFAPLIEKKELLKTIVEKAFGINCEPPFELEFEYAPDRIKHLNDATAFDVYVSAERKNKTKIGIGIEVKYTEKEYPIGKREAERVNDSNSTYWQVTKNSNAFKDSIDKSLATDLLRQIWRNHLLGLSMCLKNELSDFYSITLYPAGNSHFDHAIDLYKSKLRDTHNSKVFGCTYEKFIDTIDGDEEIKRWKKYLKDRYIF